MSARTSIVPWVSIKTSRTVALVVLRSKRTSGFPSKFTDEDIATVDAIGGAAIPYIEKAMQDDSDNRALGILSHEIRQPIGFIANAANDLLGIVAPGPASELAFEVKCWANLVSREIRNTDLFRSWPKKLLPEREFVRVDKTIEDAKRDCLPVLKKHGLSLDLIQTSGLEAVPTLKTCLLYTSPSPRDRTRSRMPSSA